ncbi:uncharacterized protein PHACADRAFT_257034 [Phanerochaete carnosa HHB-10118-sp]|uniref:Uncharacterized protein n=1 Tax=Phanerochaete carnosa (strain HHB-10118-sp) TaxID=650164 RepID=K5WAL5_PHACS|nr:uncharacterized protein PHACADRAFT_257034 [Phanerochaete carnosa HHB-10118-sp]EKM56019.1 hypothetical protein PHACADRAFT_257034 [Phanerochaete carnosa HHB-10118-sp]
MPPRGQKRAATETEPRTTRSKVAKTDAPANGKAAGKGAKRGSKASLGAAAFKAKALPIHVNLTHTPPVLVEDAKDIAQTDPGFIGQTSLAPTTFSTGSYGWKGTKRVTIELENNETGEMEKVQVMMTFNATVIGSKNAPGEDEEVAEAPEAETSAEADGEAKGEKVDEAPAEAAQETAEPAAETAENAVEMAE